MTKRGEVMDLNTQVKVNTGETHMRVIASDKKGQREAV